jgi:flagella basal body P-ring formation protein FlgA
MDWTATDLNRNLELRGIKKGLVVWQGPESVRLLRQRPVSAAASKPTSSESNGMVPAFVSDRLLSQAEGNLVQATREYLWLQTNERTQWRIKLKLPVELASSLSQRKNILSLGGGQAPWTGRQVFVYLIKHEGEEHELEMHVDVDYPTEVVVASRTLRRDEVLDESCLTYAPIGERQENAVDGFFEDMSELIGKQVRQAVSTGLPIPRTAIGEAHVISSGEIVELESVSGGIVVKVAAKALSGGAVGDTINVEMTPGRRRLAATVVNAGLVRILNKAASGDAPPEQEPMGKTSAPVATAKKTKARGELR